jgi:hypothetical protein
MVSSNFSEDRVIDNILAQNIPEEIHDDLIDAMLKERFETTESGELSENLIASINSVMQKNPSTNEETFYFDDVFLSKLSDRGGSENLVLAFTGSYRCRSGRIVANPSLC